MYNVIICGNDYSMAKTIFKQIKNLKNAMPDANIEVVFNRSAVKTLLKGSEYIPDIKELIQSGIKINACRNTLKEMKLSEEEVDTGAGIGMVNAAVEEIVRKQADGYYYLQL
ncbi:MAG: DsrE family protein [Ferroplasma sp.]|uniref:DsrE family protein n=1 Tax=Ferroplasma sp. TaxID=2591003 RepID=UPI0028150889|nr:DsrE family protein [Ferroplasma sp.]WMT51419.1 MAG: DsrE family protein [Ferroplasma sp.]